MPNSRWLALLGLAIYGTTIGALILRHSLRRGTRDWTTLGIALGTMGYSYLATGLLVLTGGGISAQSPEWVPLVLGTTFLILACYWPWVSLVRELSQLAEKRRAIMLGFLMVALPGLTIGIFPLLSGGLGFSHPKVGTLTMVSLLTSLGLLHLVAPGKVLGLVTQHEAASRERVFLWVVPLVLPSVGVATIFGEYFVAVLLILTPILQALYAIRAVRAIRTASQESIPIGGEKTRGNAGQLRPPFPDPEAGPARRAESNTFEE